MKYRDQTINAWFSSSRGKTLSSEDVKVSYEIYNDTIQKWVVQVWAGWLAKIDYLSNNKGTNNASTICPRCQDQLHIVL